MKRPNFALSLAALFAGGAFTVPVSAQWSQNGSVGPYDYASSANWVGGTINNLFASMPASGLNITFGPENFPKVVPDRCVDGPD